MCLQEEECSGKECSKGGDQYKEVKKNRGGGGVVAEWGVAKALLNAVFQQLV